MIEAAIDDFDIDLDGSWMIGDKKIDIETGFNAGIGTALVLTGYGRTVVDSLQRQPDIIASDLLEAVKAICERATAAS
jgi:histidinol phosphatase-like enzyme